MGGNFISEFEKYIYTGPSDFDNSATAMQCGTSYKMTHMVKQPMYMRQHRDKSSWLVDKEGNFVWSKKDFKLVTYKINYI